MQIEQSLVDEAAKLGVFKMVSVLKTIDEEVGHIYPEKKSSLCEKYQVCSSVSHDAPFLTDF